MIRTAIPCIALTLACIGTFLPVPAASAQPPAPSPEATAFFENEVRPLLAKNCFECHGPKKQKGALRLDSRARLLQGGDRGPALVPGDPARSLLLSAVNGTGDVKMPPRDKLTAEQVTTLQKWIAQGAPWPGADAPVAVRTSAITDKDRQFWAFQPLAHPAVPHVPETFRAWNRNPVDAFILQQLLARGLTPAAPADRRTLLRRATFDLIGLPPTPEEIDAFLADTSPEAFARVVERLLASPHYGERWGRHWLDVVRYADTAGETADYPVPQARLYRDYVIDSFNKDKPYDVFLREQVAGDLLAEAGPADRYGERVIATGFIALSRRFGFDPQNYHHLTIQDTIDTLGQATLGLTLGCARCHDHKYDPISREDYYALYGIFASTKYAFPGSEEKKRPADLVPLGVTADSKGVMEVAYAVVDGKPQNARIHLRGEPRDLGPEVPRRFLEILGGDPLPGNMVGSGRRQLADWITRPSNPLTPRVMVNRLWQHHFGVGLVATENDFGARGRRPTHPELLDYLAERFQQSGWSVKAMHRLILLSQTYQQGNGDARACAADPDNQFLSRFARRRLEAEAIRDALLRVGGNLDPTPGGPHPFPPVDKWNYTQHDPFHSLYDTPKRSVYLMTPRLTRHPYLALFDGPDTNASTARRLPTTVPTQALFFMNDPFVHTQAAGLARRVLMTSDDAEKRLTLAFTLTLARPPTGDEIRQSLAFLERYRMELASEPPAEQEKRAWAALARTLLARNEFIYVD
jgi:mono/diheme cytochrome c family protein